MRYTVARLTPRRKAALATFAGGHEPVAVQPYQAIGVMSQVTTGPVQAQQQGMGLDQGQCILYAARGLRHPVCAFRALGRIHAGQVQHPGTCATRTEHGRAGTAVIRRVIEKTLSLVQPGRLQFGQGHTNRRGPHAAFRPVDADTCNQVCTPVWSIDRAVDIDHHAIRIG